METLNDVFVSYTMKHSSVLLPGKHRNEEYYLLSILEVYLVFKQSNIEKYNQIYTYTKELPLVTVKHLELTIASWLISDSEHQWLNLIQTVFTVLNT